MTPSILETLLGVVLIIGAAGMLFAFALPGRGRSRVTLRRIPAFQRLRRAIGLTVENGSRLHISVGQANIVSPNNGSALAGLATLNAVGRLASNGDRPPIATSGDGTLAVLSQDTLKAVYRDGGAPDQFSTTQGRLAGPTPFSYIAGTLPVIHDERVSTNIVIGSFGPEVALLAEAAERENSFFLAGSDAISAQAVLYATAAEPLIGEELFAVPAYVQGQHPSQQAGLRAQDVLRWVLIGAMLVGAALAFVGVL